jgi:glycosyltransferase involved in cell wall biosynthesis
MPRIGIDVRLAFYRQGGIAQYSYALLRELGRLDSDHNYIVLHSRKDKRNLASGSHQRKASCWTPAHHRFERAALAFEIGRHRLDLLHSPDFIPPTGGAKRFVITVHDLAFLLYPEILTPDSHRYYNDQIRIAVDKADAILAVSETTKADLINLVGAVPEKIAVTPEAASDQHRPASKEEIERVRLAHELPTEYLLFVGTLEPRKNLGGLLRAYAEIVAEMPDVPMLVIAGRRGWLYDQIFTLVQTLHLENKLVWVEDPPDADMPALYSGAVAFCLPSRYEGFGLPALEAMACGTPVVVSDKGSLPEVVGEAGVLVNPDDPAQIAKGIKKILADTTLATTLRSKGLQRASTFTWGRMAEQTLAVYNHLLES